MDSRRLARTGIVKRVALSVFGLLTVALLLLAVFNEKGVLQVRAQSHKFEELSTEVKSLESENGKIKKEIESLKSDPAEIERIAREDLKLVKRGEVVIVTQEKKQD